MGLIKTSPQQPVVRLQHGPDGQLVERPVSGAPKDRGYVVKPEDAAAIVEHVGTLKTLDKHLRERLYKSLNRLATDEVAVAWAAAKKDMSGALQLQFLRNWCADPACGFVRLLERQGTRTAQTVRGVWAYRTYGQILKLHGGDKETAEALVSTAAAVMPHPQDPHGKNAALRLYLVFEALVLEKGEENYQERVLEGEAELQGGGAGEFARLGTGPSNMASALPAPGELGAPQLAVRGPKGGPKKAAKPAPDEARTEAASKLRQLASAIAKLNSWRKGLSEGVEKHDDLDVAYAKKVEALQPPLEKIEAALTASLKAFDKKNEATSRKALIDGSAEAQERLKSAQPVMKAVAAHMAIAKKGSTRSNA